MFFSIVDEAKSLPSHSSALWQKGQALLGQSRPSWQLAFSIHAFLATTVPSPCKKCFENKTLRGFIGPWCFCIALHASTPYTWRDVTRWKVNVNHSDFVDVATYWNRINLLTSRAFTRSFERPVQLAFSNPSCKAGCLMVSNFCPIKHIHEAVSVTTDFLLNIFWCAIYRSRKCHVKTTAPLVQFGVVCSEAPVPLHGEFFESWLLQ